MTRFVNQRTPRLFSSSVKSLRHQPVALSICFAASSSPLTLRYLVLNELWMTTECCGPVLERVLALGCSGLQTLHLSGNELKSYSRNFIRIIFKYNHRILEFKMDGLGDLEWEDEEEGLEGKCVDTLNFAIARNKRLTKGTQQAAIGTLKVARVVLLGSRRPSSSSNVLGEPSSSHFRLLDLSPELLPIVVSFVYPGALSQRQLQSVLRHAADRTTFLSAREGQAIPHNVQRSLNRRTKNRTEVEACCWLSLKQTARFLMDTGCGSYDLAV